jgi:hypothetical protein
VQKGVAQQQVDTQLETLQAQYDKQERLANGILQNPALDEITGPVAGRLPSTVAPFLSGKSNIGQATDLQSDVNQLSDMGFLSGAHNMRQAIGGRVTNVEATAANEAQTQLHNQAQSPGHYRQSIQNVLDESGRAMAANYIIAGFPVPVTLQKYVKDIPPEVIQQYNAGIKPPPTFQAPNSVTQPVTKKYAINPRTGTMELQQ